MRGTSSGGESYKRERYSNIGDRLVYITHNIISTQYSYYFFMFLLAILSWVLFTEGLSTVPYSMSYRYGRERKSEMNTNEKPQNQ